MSQDQSGELNIRGESDAEVIIGLRYNLRFLRKEFDAFKRSSEEKFEEYRREQIRTFNDYCREKDNCEEANEKRLIRLEKFMWLIVGGLLVIEFIFKLWKL